MARSFWKRLEKEVKGLALMPSFPFIRATYGLQDQAERCVHSGDMDGAVRLLRSALKIKPRSRVLLQRTGEVEAESGHPRTALEYFKLLVRHHPQRRSHWAKAAGALLLSAEWDEKDALKVEKTPADQADGDPIRLLLASAGLGQPPADLKLQLATDTLRELERWGRALWNHNRFETARRVWLKELELQAQWMEERGIGDFVFPSGWTRSFGHIAFFDFVIKMVRLGWIHLDRAILILSDHQEVANRVLLEYWGDFVELIREGRVSSTGQEASTIAELSTNTYRLLDGRMLFQAEAAALVQEAWEVRRSAPLLRTHQDHYEQGWEALHREGVPKDGWFVALHVRDTGYKQDFHNRQRNADILTYVPAMEAITRRGGWVVRLGDSTMTALPAMPQVIDYAHVPWRTEWMDVFLMSQCRFLIGTNSGPALVPRAFGLPVVFTNWFPFSQTYSYGRDLLIPKLYQKLVPGRLLSFKEMAELPFIHERHPEYLREKGLELRNNTPEEIEEVVIEMLDRCENSGPEPAAPSERQRRLQSIVESNWAYRGLRLGEAFLDRYRSLLE